MQIADANVILRYLLKDDKTQFGQAKLILEKNGIFIPFEITAEIVYVLEKVYNISREEISSTLSILFTYDNLSFINKKIVLKALEFYSSYKLDYADSLLCAYKAIENHEIFTFDKRLLKVLDSI
ncbi:MAG: PIN domain-containing protein [Ignavibacteriaceae bacterium]